MDKLDYIYRPVKIEDYNRVVDTINALIEQLSEKPVIYLSWEELDVKDIHTYTSLDISLPYNKSVTITDLEALKELSISYNIPYDISKAVIDTLWMKCTPVLNIHFEESPEVKDVPISQWEISLQELEDNVKPKKWRKKKDGTTKQARSTTKKDSWTNKKWVRKRKS